MYNGDSDSKCEEGSRAIEFILFRTCYACSLAGQTPGLAREITVAVIHRGLRCDA